MDTDRFEYAGIPLVDGLITAGVNRVSVGIFFIIGSVCRPDQGGISAPISGQSDNFGIPTRVSQVSLAG